MVKNTSREVVSLRRKLIAWCCVGMQLLPPVSSIVIAIPASAAEKQQTQNKDQAQPVNPFEQQLASGSAALGTALSDENRSSSQALSDYARGQAGSAASSSIENALAPYGTVRAQLNFDNNFSLSDSSLDMLVPLYDAPKNLLFTQLGGRRKDDRTTLNAGLGMRLFPSENWMFGLNTFFDNDITGHNYRLGVGGEAWTDYLKLSANTYQRLNSWHQSRDFADYDERPANGYDMRMNAFLPAYPQLGGKLVYEQYYGNEVALFGKDQRQKDPYAVTVGVNYTPVPMLTLGADQKLGKSGKDDLSLNMQVTYQIGKSWAENTLPEAVDAMRKLGRTRYDLVERNNDIILEYRKQETIRLKLASDYISGEGYSTQVVATQVSSKHGLKNITWSGDNFTAAGGSIKASDKGHFSVTLPAWQAAQSAQATKTKKAALKSTSTDANRIANTYVLTAVAQDNNGNSSQPAELTVEVLQPQAHFSGKPTISGNNAAPDGKSAVVLAWQLKDSSGHPLAGQEVTFTITYADGSKKTITVISDKNGNISVPVTSDVAGDATVVATLPNGESSSATINFSQGQVDAAHSTLTAVPSTINNNGKDTATLTLKANDSNGKPVTGLTAVKLPATGVKGLKLSAVSESAPGVYTATVSGTTAGTAAFTASVNSQVVNGLNAQVILAGNNADAQISAGNLSVDTDNQVANNVVQNKVQIKVTDSSGNPLAGQTVSLQADNGATIASSATTDENGQVIVPLTSTKAGVVNVTARINNSTQTVQVTFVANPVTAQIATGALTVTHDNALANATATNSVQAVVTDAYGNPVSGVDVSFSADNSATASGSAKTNASGVATATLTSTVAGISHVTAQVNGSSQSTNVTFIADNGSAKLNAGDLTVVSDNAIANGNASNDVQVRVKDANGNPAGNLAINFTADNGATIVSSVMTDENGIAQAPLQNLKAGITHVTATVNGTSQGVDTTFVADASTMKGALSVTTDNVAANGTATNSVLLTVKDTNGNPVPNVATTFSASNNAAVDNASGQTDASGQMSTTLTSHTAGVSVVTVQTANGDTLTVNVNFTADSSTAKVAAGDLTVTRDGAVANNIASNRVQAKVTDASGNVVSGVNVTFAAGNGATITASAVTDSNGLARATLQSTKAGTSVVTATVNGNSQNVNTSFVADRTTAQLKLNALTVAQDNALADGSETNSVNAEVTDKYDNPVDNIDVSFTATNGAVIAATATSDSNGIATASLSSTTAGPAGVTATVNGSTRSVTVNFRADSSSAKIAAGNMTVTANNAATDGTSSDGVRVLVTDSHGNPLAGQSVSFTATNGAVIATSGTTDSSGVVNMSLTSTVAGDSIVKATVNGSSQSVTVTFVADGSTAQIVGGALTVTSDNAVANGSATNSVQAIVTDAHSNPLAGKVVNFSAGNGATITASATTDASGKASVTLTSKTAGISQVIASISGGQQSVNATFVADSSSAKLAAGSFTVTSNNAVANGVASDIAQVKVTDANGNLLAGQAVSFTSDNSPTTTLPSTATTDANGIARIQIQSIKATDISLTATVNGSSQNATATFIADNSTAAVKTLTTSTDNAKADGSAADQVHAIVKDANGNTVPDVTVNFTADNGATVNATATTDATGNAYAGVTSKVAGTSTITASVNGSEMTTPAHFVADNSSAQIAAGNLSVVTDNALANGTDFNSVKVKVTDKNGNPLAGQNVAFTATNGATIAASGTTDASGMVTVKLTSTTAGSSSVTAKVNGSVQSVSVNFAYDTGTAAVSSLTVTKDNAIANGTATNGVQAVIKDKFGNVIPGISVSFSSDNGATIAATGTSDSNGVVVMTLTSKTAGESAVTATVNGNTQSVNTVFIADSSTAQIAANNLKVTSDNAVANGLSTNVVQVKVLDANGNPIAGQTVNFTADNSATITATGKTDAQGLLSVTLSSKKAGVSKVTATTNGSNQSVNTTFIANASTAQVGSGDLIVLTDNAAANGVATNSVQALVTDANGNPVPGVSVNFASVYGATVTSPVVTDVNGKAVATVTSTTSSGEGITASINGSKQTVLMNFWADPATVKITSIKVVTDNAKTDGKATNSVLVTVRDKAGNTSFYQPLAVNFTADNGAVIASTGTINAQGQVTMTLTDTKAGVSTVTASINGSTNSAQVTFVPDASTATIVSGNLSVDKSQIMANGVETATYKAVVTDANNNLLPGVKVTWITDKGTLAATSSITDSNGVATVGLTAVISGASAADGKAQVSAQVGSAAAVNASLVALVVPPQTYSGAAVTYQWSDSPKSSAINISGRTGAVSGTVTVSMSLAYAYPDLMQYTLITPDGRQIRLRNSGDGQDANGTFTADVTGSTKAGTWTLKSDSIGGGSTDPTAKASGTLSWKLTL